MLDPFHDLAGQRFTTRADITQAKPRVLMRIRQFRQSLERRGRHERMGDAMARHELAASRRIEATRPGEHRLPVRPCRKHKIQQAAHPCPVGGRPEDGAWLVHGHVVEQLRRRQVRVQKPMRVKHAFRPASGTARVHEQRRGIGARRDRSKIRVAAGDEPLELRAALYEPRDCQSRSRLHLFNRDIAYSMMVNDNYLSRMTEKAVRIYIIN